MSPPPDRPKIYHITHVNNLADMIAQGELVSDREMLRRGGPPTTIGMSTIKQRRMGLPVKCHAGTMVGDYVPFYFCPRSIMLYIIYMANHPELTYRGGQNPIVHLEADLHDVIAWAAAHDRRWAVSLSNAGAVYARFRATLAGLSEVNWGAVAATDFRQEEIKEGKQAEFLLYGSFPWHLISRIGVRLASVQTQVQDALANATHQPPVAVLPAWYY
jgi:hypothetical protein